jgi:hypothetical protein
MMSQVKLINTGEKRVELNYGQFHYELDPGDVTPPVGNELAQSFMSRNPCLQMVDEVDGYLEPNPEGKPLETFPGAEKDEDEVRPAKRRKVSR